MSIRFRLAAFSILTFALSASAFATQWTVAAASHAPGAAGTTWRTDLRLANPGSTAAGATIYLLPSDTDNTTHTRKVDVTVPAAGQISLVDVLDTSFGYLGNGALLVDSTDSRLVVTSRTYNQSGSSTFGQFIPGVESSQALQANEVGHLIYLSKSADYRTNVGYAGTTGTGGRVNVSVFDANNVLIGGKGFDVAPFGQSQINDVFTAVGAPPVQTARAEIRSSVPIVAYASVIDNRTGDPIATIAQHLREARTELAIPAVAHTAGAGNSSWRSDVKIFYPIIDAGRGGDGGATTTVPVTLRYYPSNSGSGVITKMMSLAPGRLLALDDVLQNLFGLPSATGALRISASVALFATSRTYNQSATGTFGQDIPAVAITNTLTDGMAATFSGLSDSGYRTNIGFFNIGTTAADLMMELRSPAGQLIASKTTHVDAGVSTQINNLFGFFGASATPAASLRVTTTGGSTIAYASVIDNASGDPVFVPASLGIWAPPVDPGPSGTCVTVPYVSAGRKASYRITQPGVGTYTKVTTFLSDAPTSMVVSEKATTSQSEVQIDSTFTFEVKDALRSIVHSVSTATTSVAGFSIIATTDSTYSSPMPISPAGDFCAGRTWVVPALTQTVVLSGSVPGSTTLLNRPAATGSVVAVNESVTVAAGVFNTVRYHGVNGNTDASTQSSNVWLSTRDGVIVKEEDLDAAGKMIATVELTSLQ